MGNTAASGKAGVTSSKVPGLAKAPSLSNLRRSLRRHLSAAGDVDRRQQRNGAVRVTRTSSFGSCGSSSNSSSISSSSSSSSSSKRRTRPTVVVRSSLCDNGATSRCPGNVSQSDESTEDGDVVEASSGCSIIVTDCTSSDTCIDVIGSQSRGVSGLPILDINKYKIGVCSNSEGKAATISRTTGLSPDTASPLTFNRRSQTLQVNHRGPPVTGENKNHHVSFSFGQLDRSASLAVVPGATTTGGGSKDVWLETRIRLDKYMSSKWISGIAVTKRGEYAIVDLQEAFLIDSDGLFRRQIGGKGAERLLGPIGVTVLATGELAFSDHATQDIKVFTTKGQYVTTVRSGNFSNIAGIASDDAGHVYVAGADRKQIFVVPSIEDTDAHSQPLLTTIPASSSGGRGLFDHPYSIACCSKTGDVIVGDDSRQMVTAVSGQDGHVLWRFCPPGHGQRHFFPSSIAVDEAAGVVFVADLYNEKVYAVDMTSGAYIKTVLARGDELRGGPSAIAVDGAGHLLVADEEKTLKVFGYSSSSFTRVTPASSNGSIATSTTSPVKVAEAIPSVGGGKPVRRSASLKASCG